MLIKVHRNLHAARQDAPQWSVTDTSGRVVAREPYVALADVATLVQPAGVARCKTTGVRAVCARFKGRPAALWELPDATDVRWMVCEFDPRLDDAFMAAAFGLRMRWNRADFALCGPSGACSLFNPRWEEPV